MEDLPDHARRHYRLGQPGPCPLAWTRLGHGLYRAHDTGRRTPPRGPLPRLARSMAEEARTIRLQAMAGFCLGQDRGDPGVCALRRSGRLRRLPLTFQRLVVLTEEPGMEPTRCSPVRPVRSITVAPRGPRPPRYPDRTSGHSRGCLRCRRCRPYRTERAPR